jgi:hypothetical protein
MDVVALRKSTFAQVSADKTFHVCRGDQISNIKDLANCIASLKPEEFAHHVNAKRNDFSIWIHDVLKNPALARDLNYPVNLNSQQHFVKTLRDHLTWLESA